MSSVLACPCPRTSCAATTWWPTRPTWSTTRFSPWRACLRAKDGYLLTAAGETALATARRMESAALDLRTRIEGQDTSPGGLVRVTSTDSIAIDLLMPAIERLQQHWPHIRVDLEVSTQLLRVSRRPTVAWSTPSLRAAAREVGARVRARKMRASSPFMVVPSLRMKAECDANLHRCRAKLLRLIHRAQPYP